MIPGRTSDGPAPGASAIGSPFLASPDSGWARPQWHSPSSYSVITVERYKGDWPWYLADIQPITDLPFSESRHRLIVPSTIFVGENGHVRSSAALEESVEANPTHVVEIVYVTIRCPRCRSRGPLCISTELLCSPPSPSPVAAVGRLMCPLVSRVEQCNLSAIGRSWPYPGRRRAV